MKIEIFKNEKAKVEQDLKSIKRKSDLISWIFLFLLLQFYIIKMDMPSFYLYNL